MFFLLAYISFTPVVQDKVDMIEVNHLYNGSGAHTLDQVIFWSWYEDGFHVRDWRLLQQCAWPEKNGGCWIVRWFDCKTNVQREVRGYYYAETWTQSDPETRDQKLLPCGARISLSSRFH